MWKALSKSTVINYRGKTEILKEHTECPTVNDNVVNDFRNGLVLQPDPHLFIRNYCVK